MFLKVAGYRVSAAASTEEAVEHARRHHDLEFVISDYHLGPGETGVDAIAAVRAVRDQGLRAVLMSGDAGLRLTDVERGPDTAIAHKPINPDELLALLPARQSLSGRHLRTATGGSWRSSITPGPSQK